MTINAPANYDTELAKASRSPSYAVGLVSPSGADTLEYVTAPMLNGGDYATAKTVLRPISLEYAGDPRASRFIPSNLKFDLVDDQALVTADLTQDITGWVVTLSHNFHGVDWADRITRFVGIVTDVRYTESRYRVTARSRFCTAAIGAKLHASATMKLAAALSSTATEAVVYDASAAQADGGFVRIAAERLAYTSTRDNGNSTWSLLGLTRGYGTSTAAAHSLDDQVFEWFIYDLDHPFDMIQTILQNTGDKDGLGLGANAIDSSGFSTAKTDLGAFDFYIEAWQASNAKAFLESQLFRPTASYPVENNLGELRPKLLDMPDTGDFVVTIADADVLGEPVFKGRFEVRANDVVIEHDDDLTSFDGTFDAQYRKTKDSLVTLSGRRFTLQIQAKGIQAATSGSTAFLEGRADSFLDRFGLQAPVLEFETGMGQELLEVGDPIYCTFQHVINLPAATRGMTAYPFEIIGMKYDYTRGKIQFRVLGYPPLASIPDQTFTAAPVHSDAGVTSTVA